MDDKQMISFPRELTDELAEVIADKARVCGGGAFDIWEAICDGFGQLADKPGRSRIADLDPEGVTLSFGSIRTGEITRVVLPACGEPEVVAVITETDDVFPETDVIHRPGIDSLPAGTELVDRSHVTMLQAELAALREDNNSLADRFEQCCQTRDALREELAKANREKNDVACRANETAERLNSMTISKATMRNKLKQRLTAAERRNANVNTEAAAKMLAACMDYPWEHMPEQGRASMREHAKDVIDAALKPTESGASK